MSSPETSDSDRLPTLGEAILHARARADQAEATFRDVVRAALTAGASTREVAALLDWNATTLWRWACAGKPRVITGTTPFSTQAAKRDVLNDRLVP